MPATRFEYIVGILGATAVVVLAGLTVLAYRDYRDSRAPAAAVPKNQVQLPTAPSVGAALSPHAPLTETSGAAAATTGTTDTISRPPARAARKGLVLSAERGDSWLEVHAGSSTGTSMYEGVLAQGGTRRFAAPTLWVRLGAPQNIDARLNGKRIVLPSSTATVLVAHNRVTTLSLG